MKTVKSLLILTVALFIISCGGNNTENEKDTPAETSYLLEYEKDAASYGTDLTVETKNIVEENNVFYTNENGVITFNTATAKNEEKDIEVTLKGYFQGQIVNNVKNLVIKLDNAYLINKDQPVFICNEKTEFSAKKDSVNYIVTTGDFSDKTGTVNAAKKVNLKLGGSGKCYIVDSLCHGIKADKVEFKGSGEYFIQGTTEGSSVNCNKFEIEEAEPEEQDKFVTLHFYNAKNGIKADKSIDIQNGKLFFYGNKTALKTDKAEEGKDKNTINLANCTITLKDVKTLQETDDFTKAENVTVTEE